VKTKSTDLPSGGRVLELLVVEGSDTGQRFTLDLEEMQIGRGTPRAGRPSGVLLRDPSVGAQQASIRREGNAALLEHDARASTPTLVNGKAVTRLALAPGDRIRVGDVVLEVQARGGGSLSGLFALASEEFGRKESSGDTTEIRPGRAGEEYCLEVVAGLPEHLGRRLPLQPERTVLGRGDTADIRVPNEKRGVSRRHAELRRTDHGLLLVHHSRVNATLVNGVPVADSRIVMEGDEIRLADDVVFRLSRSASQGPARRAQPSPTMLLRRLEERLQLDPGFEATLRIEGTFLDVDVKDSYGMKAGAQRADQILLSFARWRAWVARIVTEFEGEFLNSNGDEVMCFFRSPLQAVRAGDAILERLAVFNLSENLLARPFVLRLGIHTGESLVDQEHGIAYSEALDIAGHLQKLADPNDMLISEGTLRQLPPGLPFAPAQKLERQGITSFRRAGPLGGAWT
jgi:pSer/pThr/pTyr-binding forkhead associated (FHA) protein